jgi:exopolysaccharide biosynthesis WecB/TagA/CpsF family protein
MLFDKLITDESVILELIKANINRNHRLLVTYLNQNCFNMYSENIFYKNLLDNIFTVYADGIGIKFAIRFILGKKYHQFNATDLNEKILDILIKQNIKFFIIGGNFNQRELLAKFNYAQSFVGYNNGFFLDSEIENITEKIRIANPDVVIIGMGVPNQEIVAEKLSRSINASLFLCVGNFFEFYFGTAKRIPVRFRNKGIEWMYRLFHDPKRLWKRYLIGIPLFIFRVIRFKLRLNKFG